MISQDRDYKGESYGAAFDGKDHLATTCYDGYIRLYGVTDSGLTILGKTASPGGHRPFSLAFSPDGTQLAVGYTDTTAVDILDAKTLSPLGAPNLRGVDNGNLASVAFAADGSLLAAGRWVTDRGCPVRRFTPSDFVQYRDLDTGKSTVVTLCPLPDGGLAYGTVAPRWGVLRPDGSYGMEIRFAEECRRTQMEEERQTAHFEEFLDSIDEMKTAMLEYYATMPKPLALMIHHHAAELLKEAWHSPDARERLQKQTRFTDLMVRITEDLTDQVDAASRKALPEKTLAFMPWPTPCSGSTTASPSPISKSCFCCSATSRSTAPGTAGKTSACARSSHGFAKRTSGVWRKSTISTRGTPNPGAKISSAALTITVP